MQKFKEHFKNRKIRKGKQNKQIIICSFVKYEKYNSKRVFVQLEGWQLLT